MLPMHSHKLIHWEKLSYLQKRWCSRAGTGLRSLKPLWQFCQRQLNKKALSYNSVSWVLGPRDPPEHVNFSILVDDFVMRMARNIYHKKAWPEKQETVFSLPICPKNCFGWPPKPYAQGPALQSRQLYSSNSSHYYIVHIIKVQAAHFCF